MGTTNNQPYEGVRQELGKLLGERHTFTAVFIRTSKRQLTYNPVDDSQDWVDTFLFRQVKLAANGNMVAEHIWCDSSPLLREANLLPGNMVEIDAKVNSYARMLRSEGGTTAIQDYALLPLYAVTVTGHETRYIGRNKGKTRRGKRKRN
jgi:hypothetical protein